MTTLETNFTVDSSERAELVSLVRQWAGLNTDAVLDPACIIFSAPSVTGFIGYRLESGCAVVYGDPVCAPEDKPVLAQIFNRYAQEQEFEVIYVAASQEFADWAIKTIAKSSIEFGEELFFDPHINPKHWTGTHGSLVRRKVRHAQKEGVAVQEYSSRNLELEKAIEQAGEEWLKARRGPQIRISNVHLFNDREGKRWFYAMHKDRVVGVLLLNELKSRSGWLLNHVMFVPQSPGGTPEILVTTALETLEKENCSYVTVGPVPKSHLGKITGLGTTSTLMSRVIFKTTVSLCHLDGKSVFWNKFHPQSTPIYLLFTENRIRWKYLRALTQGLM